MQIVKARFRTRDEFLGAYSRDLPYGGLFIPTTTPLASGSEVVVELNCDGLPNKVLIRGKVQSWRPALPRLRVRAGAVVAFAAEENTKRDFILGTIEGTIKAQRRRHTRIPIAVPVTFRMLETAEVRQGDLTEISIGGALLQAAPIPPLGSELVLYLTAPGGGAPMEIMGKVSHHTSIKGSGVKFTFRDGGGARRLRELIRRIRVA